VSQIFQGLNGAFHRMRRHSVERNAKAFKLVSGFAPVSFIGAQDQVGLERYDLFQIGLSMAPTRGRDRACGG